MKYKISQVFYLVDVCQICTSIFEEHQANVCDKYDAAKIRTVHVPIN